MEKQNTDNDLIEWEDVQDYFAKLNKFLRDVEKSLKSDSRNPEETISCLEGGK